MVNVKEIINYFDEIAPWTMAESYDNVGLLIGNSKKEVKKVLVSLDTDEFVADEAEKAGADLIISHHPLIFKPINRITDSDSVQRTVMSLIKKDIAQISVHTNFDSAKSGLGDLFLDKIAQTNDRISLDCAEEFGIGRIADLREKKKLCDILKRIKEEFSLYSVRFIGDSDRVVSKIAVCNGGGAEFIEQAKKLGADCFVSGDIKYHQARFAYENDIAFIEIPHYSAEIIFCEYVKKILTDKFGDKIEISVSHKNIDIWKHFE